MAGKADLSKFNCSLAKALGRIGDWWTLLIIRDAFLGSTRFGEFQTSLGLARNILASRLEALVDVGILTRSGTSTRPLYMLTRKGKALLPSLVALMQWGDQWESAGNAPILVTDANGDPAAPVVVTSKKGRTLTAETTRFGAGPSANAKTRDFLAARSAAGLKSS